jgi:hypothetical protein
MTTIPEGRKRSTVPIIVRMRASERDLLKDVLFEEGCSSMSSWLRMQAIAKLKQAGALQDVELNHVDQ